MSRDSDNKKYWQKMAGLYAKVMKDDDPIYREIVQDISKYLMRDMDVLECACGTGQLSFPLYPKVKSFLATDFSENMVAEAEKRPHHDSLKFKQADATKLPFASGQFDAVIISNALHIMPDPEKALEEIRRVLKPDGWLFAPTIVWKEAGLSKLWKFGLQMTGFKVYRLFCKESFKTFITSNGFQVFEDRFYPDRRTPILFVAAKPAGKDSF